MSADAAALDALDRLLVETLADAMTLGWGCDRPLLPSEARATLARHKAKPSSMVAGSSRETVFASERQLRAQHASFLACAAALRAGDATAVPSGNPPGSGHDEVRELLTDAAELASLLPERKAEREAEHAILAAEFEAAAEVCLATAIDLQKARHSIHARDYQRVLLDAIAAEEAEAARRAKHAGKSVEGAGA